MADEQGYADLDALIVRLETTARIDHVAIWENARQRRRASVERMFDEGIKWGEASGAHPIFNQDENAFRAELKSIMQNLNAQIEIFNYELENYFKTGDHPPPYYPMRIAIILRKHKDSEREKRFLSAYCKHFACPKGSRTDIELVERARKLGLIVQDVI